jgi:hypothetical protein
MQQLLLYLFIFISFFGCDSFQQEDVFGCTDPSACNFNSEANIYVPNSCFYTLDCNGECGGLAVIDGCGVCGGDNTICSQFELSISETGESSLIIFEESITSLEYGDIIGVFDNNGITNSGIYGDGDTESEIDFGEILVGVGIWENNQLEISAIGSLNMAPFDGPWLAGYVNENDIIVKIYSISDLQVHPTQIEYSIGNGTFGQLITAISNITILD